MGEEVDEVIRYHLAELEIVQNLHDPRRLVPELRKEEKAVLDIGCGIGQTLLAPELCRLERRCGIDIDAKVIAYGQKRFPELQLVHAGAEALPFAANEFDLVISRVALPYTNIPVALREIRRVLKPAGRCWVALHPPRMELDRLRRAIMTFSFKTIVDSAYVWINSVLFNVGGLSIPRLPSGQHESVQTPGGMGRALRKAGFDGISITLKPPHFFVDATAMPNSV